MIRRRYALVTTCVALSLFASACSGTADQSTPAATTDPSTQSQSDSAATVASDPQKENLVIIDVRTPEEFAEGHLEGAVNIDIYAEDFAQQIAALDPSGNYAVYCRSGNRSGQAVSFMQGEGFKSVTDLGSRVAAAEALATPIVK